MDNFCSNMLFFFFTIITTILLSNTSIIPLNHPFSSSLSFHFSFNYSLHGLRHEEEKIYELEMAWITAENKRQFEHVPTELQAQAEEAAHKWLEERENEENETGEF